MCRIMQVPSNCVHTYVHTQVKFPKNGFLKKKEQFTHLESLLPPRPAIDENITDDVDEVETTFISL